MQADTDQTEETQVVPEKPKPRPPEEIRNELQTIVKRKEICVPLFGEYFRPGDGKNAPPVLVRELMMRRWPYVIQCQCLPMAIEVASALFTAMLRVLPDLMPGSTVDKTNPDEVTDAVEGQLKDISVPKILKMISDPANVELIEKALPKITRILSYTLASDPANGFGDNWRNKGVLEASTRFVEDMDPMDIITLCQILYVQNIDYLIKNASAGWTLPTATLPS